MLTSKNKTFTEIMNLFILDNPDFKLSQEMKDFLLKLDNENETFSTSDGRNLYRFIFEIWSTQHNHLLDASNDKKIDLLPIHIEFLLEISQETRNYSTTRESSALKQKWLITWESSLSYLSSFIQNAYLQTPEKYSQYNKNMPLSLRILAIILRSPEDTFAIFMISSFIIVIPIAWYIAHLPY
jgi:hypothetical protein